MMLKTIAFAAALGLTAAAAHAAPPAPQATTPPAAKGMTYDCTKAGNKNKAACKNVTPAATAAAPATASKTTTMTAKTTPAKATTTTTATTPAKPMNYDCTKAGNANKQACKNVVVPPATATAAKPAAAAMPVAPARTAATVAQTKTATTTTASTKAMGPNEVAATLKNGKTVHYDCSKAGNKDKKACEAAGK